MEIEQTLNASLAKYVLLFSDCLPVKGAKVSAIYDLARGSISTFPSAYFELLEQFRTLRLGELLAEFPDDRDQVHAFLGFLLGNEYVTFVDDLASFPAIPSAWDAPGTIQDAVIDVRTRHHDYPKIIAELDALGCQHLQIRSYAPVFGVAELVAVAGLCRGTSIQTLQAHVPHDPTLTDDDYAKVVAAHRLIVGLIVHSADANRQIRVDYGAQGSSAALAAVVIDVTTRRLESHLDCGTITTKELLRPTTPTFNELRQFNGCLNRKVSVDEHGDVRNCPAMGTSFGHHAKVALPAVVSSASFQRVWTSRKDEIKVCQDCQYRYACTDCRAFVASPDVEDAKPLKCGYDPYSDTWADWRTQPGAAAAQETYRKRRHLPVVS